MRPTPAKNGFPRIYASIGTGAPNPSDPIQDKTDVPAIQHTPYPALPLSNLSIFNEKKIRRAPGFFSLQILTRRRHICC